MSKGYRKKVWKRTGVVLLVILVVVEFFLIVHGYDEIKGCNKINNELIKQLQVYAQKEEKAEELEDIREVFLAQVEMSDYLQAGDKVDIRIRYFNAKDYIVLSGKKLVKCEAGRGIVLLLAEEEILSVSSAIADCENYENTKLYAVEYPEEVDGHGGSANYISNIEILAMLGKETTEGERRIALEQRLAKENE